MNKKKTTFVDNGFEIHFESILIIRAWLVCCFCVCVDDHPLSWLLCFFNYNNDSMWQNFEYGTFFFYIYVKTSKLTSEKRNQDLHLFTSNVIFSRIATTDMSNTKPNVEANKLTADDVLLTSGSLKQERLAYAYSVLLARILCKLPAFQSYKKLIPEHLPHEYSKKMEAKSLVYPLPIQFRNEAKHEDCLCIMDTYEDQLIKMFTEAFGKS